MFIFLNSNFGTNFRTNLFIEFIILHTLIKIAVLVTFLIASLSSVGPLLYQVLVLFMSYPSAKPLTLSAEVFMYSSR